MSVGVPGKYHTCTVLATNTQRHTLNLHSVKIRNHPTRKGGVSVYMPSIFTGFFLDKVECDVETRYTTFQVLSKRVALPS